MRSICFSLIVVASIAACGGDAETTGPSSSGTGASGGAIDTGGSGGGSETGGGQTGGGQTGGGQTGGGQTGGGAPTLDATVAVDNAVDGRALHAARLVGSVTSSQAVTGIEVSLDGGAWVVAAGVLPWSLALPTGTDIWRHHSAHTIAVRATDDDGNVSPTTTLTVRFEENRDVNGDGWPDLAVGARGGSRAYVFLGGQGGVTTTAAVAAATKISGADDELGQAVALGDVNGDGYGDLIAAAPGAASNTGAVHVFHGGPNGIAGGAVGSADTTLTGSSTFDFFGHAAIVADPNGDGIMDVVVGAAQEGANDEGRVHIFHGSTSGIVSGASPNTTIVGNGVDFNMGRTLYAGDMNDDGYEDVVVGLNYGRAQIFAGAAGGITATSGSFASASITGPATDTQFTRGGALGDVNGDGYEDLVLTNPHATNGYAVVFLGNSGGLFGNLSLTDADTTLTGGDYFGSSAAIRDVDGDGFADVVVGAFDVNGAGAIYVFDGGTQPIATTTTAGADTTVLGAIANGYFGIDMHGADYDLDGYDDVVVGAMGVSNFAGRAFLLRGSSTGLATDGASQPDASFDGENSDDNFGCLVQQVWAVFL